MEEFNIEEIMEDVEMEEIEPVVNEEVFIKLPKVFTEPPERIGNPRSPFKNYLILDYDRVLRFARNANERIRGKIHYAVITEDANDYPNSFDTILWWAVQSLLSGGTLYVGDVYDGHDFLSGWEKGRKKDGYIPYTKP